MLTSEPGAIPCQVCLNWGIHVAGACAPTPTSISLHQHQPLFWWVFGRVRLTPLVTKLLKISSPDFKEFVPRGPCVRQRQKAYHIHRLACLSRRLPLVARLPYCWRARVLSIVSLPIECYIAHGELGSDTYKPNREKRRSPWGRKWT